MPNWPADVCEARVGRGDPLADRVDPVAHRVELDQPFGAKLRVLEHDVDGGRAMVGRHRPHLARALKDVRHRGRGRFGATGLDEQRTDAVAIDAEILVAALRDDDLVARRRASAARRPRPRRDRGRNPDRRCRPSGIRPRSATTRATSRHCSWLRSAPVGLWQQP